MSQGIPITSYYIQLLSLQTPSAEMQKWVSNVSPSKQLLSHDLFQLHLFFSWGHQDLRQASCRSTLHSVASFTTCLANSTPSRVPISGRLLPFHTPAMIHDTSMIHHDSVNRNPCQTPNSEAPIFLHSRYKFPCFQHVNTNPYPSLSQNSLEHCMKDALMGSCCAASAPRNPRVRIRSEPGRAMNQHVTCSTVFCGRLSSFVDVQGSAPKETPTGHQSPSRQKHHCAGLSHHYATMSEH